VLLTFSNELIKKRRKTQFTFNNSLTTYMPKADYLCQTYHSKHKDHKKHKESFIRLEEVLRLEEVPGLVQEMDGLEADL